MTHYDDERLNYIEKCQQCGTTENLTYQPPYSCICHNCISELERIDRELMATVEKRIREIQKKREH